jgi:phosphotransferase system HPr-like phosphotransfer protein
MTKKYTCEAKILKQDGLTIYIAAQIFKLCRKFTNAKITIQANSQEVEVKNSFIDLCLLCVFCGEEIIIKAEGDGSFEAVNIIKYFLENGVDNIDEIISDTDQYPKLKINLKNETMDFSNRNFSKMDFSKKDLLLSNFLNTNLMFSKFRESSLRGVNFCDANLENSDLSYADLTGADLTNANLKNANMYSTILIGTKLENANIEGADFSYAINRYDINYFKNNNKTKFSNKHTIPYNKIVNCLNGFPEYEYHKNNTLVLMSINDKYTVDRCNWLIENPNYNSYHFSFFYCYSIDPFSQGKIGWDKSSVDLALKLIETIKRIKPHILLVHQGEAFGDAPAEFRYALILIKAHFPSLKVVVEKPWTHYDVDMSIFDDDADRIHLRKIL